MSRRAADTSSVKLRPHELWGAARYTSIKILPYLAKGIYALRDRPVVGFAPDGAYPIAITTRGVVLWDPDWWSSRTFAPVKLGCAILHECSHWLQRHSARRKDRDPKRWNVAGDAEIDDDLLPAIENYLQRHAEKEAVLRFVRTWVYPSSLNMKDGLLAEAYYPNVVPPPRSFVTGTNSNGDDESSDEGSDESANSSPTRPMRDCRCGSGAGHEHPKEDTDEARDADNKMGHSETEAEVIRFQVALDIKDFEKSYPNRGLDRGGWFRWADDELKPPVLQWQHIAARHIRRIVTLVLGNTDTSFFHPSRRQSCVGFGPGKPILPALVSPVPEIDLVIDTSGSMAQEQFVRAASEIVGIFRSLHTANFTFHTVDTAVHVTLPVRNIRDVLRTRLPGGGGTSFHSLFEMLMARKKRPNLVVIMTDGYAFVPKTPPPFPVIFILIGEHVANLPWGVNIRVPQG